MLHATKNPNQDQNNCGTGLSGVNPASGSPGTQVPPRYNMQLKNKPL